MDKNGEYHDIRAKFFCLTVPKHFVEYHLCFRKYLLTNFMDKKWREGGSITTFRRKIAVSQYRKKSYENTTEFRKKIWFQQISRITRERVPITIFRRKFSLTVPKKIVGQPFCFRKLLVWKKVIDKRG